MDRSLISGAELPVRAAWDPARMLLVYKYTFNFVSCLSSFRAVPRL